MRSARFRLQSRAGEFHPKSAVVSPAWRFKTGMSWCTSCASVCLSFETSNCADVPRHAADAFRAVQVSSRRVRQGSLCRTNHVTACVHSRPPSPGRTTRATTRTLTRRTPSSDVRNPPAVRCTRSSTSVRPIKTRKVSNERSNV